MLKVTNIITSILFLLLSISATTISAASENLELVTWGSVLPNATIDPNRASLNVQVEIGGDIPLKTHITAHTPAGNMLQRTNLGYWVPWSGKLDDLMDTFSPKSSNAINFKIFKDDDLSEELFPIKIMVAYRTATELKFGVFDLAGRRIQ
tara:strand:+ start:1388 stop:1837 length:450 start_codon:yes stop_codon:yes gene_type:complete